MIGWPLQVTRFPTTSLPTATTLIVWCPAYRLLGIRTCPVEKGA